MSNSICTWQRHYEESQHMSTSCGEEFVLGDETDETDWIKYCCFCGGKAKVIPPEPEVEEEAEE